MAHGEYSEIGCSGCKFSTYDVGQHPCSKCGYLKNAYVGYNPTAETQDETFTNTELKEYADLDDKTRHLLQNKHKEGKVEWHCACASVATWHKQEEGDELLDESVYRVVWHTENCNKSSFLEEIFQGRWIFVVLTVEK